MNLLSVAACAILLIESLINGVPSCSQTCELTKFIYIAAIIYYLIEIVVGLVLFIIASVSFKHTKIFYSKEKKFISS